MRLASAVCSTVLLSGAFAGVARAQVVTKVDSGGTLTIEGVGRVRLLGIEHTDRSTFGLGGGNKPPYSRTGPKTQPPNAVGGSFGFNRDKPARDLLRQLVLGKNVRLEFDPLAAARDARAYVFVDGTLVNAEMIRRGRARVDTSRGFAREKEFVRLQDEARAAGVGIWAGGR